ncbi:MAG: T9SS type A sorting domain-containing protein [Aureispira sp.]|nr:T9SS type A sorting domain-containing protein [Aureispira sp.]
MKGISILLLIFYSWNSWGQYNSGTSYFSPNNYIEYIAGNLPIVISAPHGGYDTTTAIPDRNCSGCSYARDSYTQELSRALKDALYAKTGCYPHVIINRLHRRKLDANRAIGDAADGNIDAENAWYAFHEFIDTAKNKVASNYTKGLYLDMHGHAHTIQRLELGYVLSGTTLRQTDSLLNLEGSSIENLVNANPNNYSLSKLLRGTNSFGTLCEQKGYLSVPSFSTPYPLSTEPYFGGGYNTNRHGSELGGTIDGIQIECNSGVRFGLSNREAFADSLAEVILDYLDIHYFPNLSTSYCLATSVKDLQVENSRSSVFPNPTKDQIFIHAKEYPVVVNIYNNLGQFIRKITVESTTDQIDLSNFDCGLLFLQLQQKNGQIEAQKIIKDCPWRN